MPDRQSDILGVSPGATEEEVKEAYREMVKVWHPDRFSHDPKLQKKAKEKLQEINLAYQQLLNRAAAGITEKTPQCPTIVETHDRKSGRSVWPVFVLLAAGMTALFYFVLKNSVEERAINPVVLTQESEPIPRGDAHRYWLQSESGKEFYIIEGPRVPLEWEIDALVEMYRNHKPKTRQTLGNFVITQSSKPYEINLIALQYRARES